MEVKPVMAAARGVVIGPSWHHQQARLTQEVEERITPHTDAGQRRRLT